MAQALGWAVVNQLLKALNDKPVTAGVPLNSLQRRRRPQRLSEK